MALNVTGGPLEFDAVVNIDQGLAQINNLSKAWNSIGDKTQKNAFIEAFVATLKQNVTELSGQADKLKAKLKELQSVPIGEQDFEGIKNLNTELGKTETAVQFLTQLTGELDKLPQTFNESTTGANRLQTQLRVLKDDLAKMKAAGQDSSPEFAAKIEEATHLEHALHNVNKELELSSSNVAGIEALGQGFKGLIGGAEAVAGAMGLMTDDAAQAEVITKNLIALQSILNGVEEVGALLDKNSALNVYLLGLQRKFASKATVEQAVSTEVLAGAQAEGVVATEAATVAQEGLNVAMLANPVGIILASIVALYAAYEILSRTLFKASDAEKQRVASQKALQEAEEKAADSTAEEIGKLNILVETAKNKVLTDEARGKALNQLRSAYPEYLSNLTLENVYTKEASDAIQKQSELIKARALERAAEEVYVEALKEQIKKQNELNDVLKNGAGFWSTLWAAVKSGHPSAEAAKQQLLKDKMEELNDAATKADGSFESFVNTQQSLAEKMGETTTAIDKQGAAWSDFGKQVGTATTQLSGILTEGNNSLEKVLSSRKLFTKEEFEAQKKYITEVYQYEVDKTKEGTAANLKARINMGKALLAFEKTNTSLFDFAGQPRKDQETQKANADALAIMGKFKTQMDSLNEELMQKALDNATAGANALVSLLAAAGEQGSNKYFAAQAAALKKAAAEEIFQAKDNAGRIAEIRAKLSLDLSNLDKERLKQQLENERSINNVRLTLIEQGSKEELALKLKNIDIDAKEELLQAGKNQDKINEINANAAKKKVELQKQYAIEAAETETNIRIAGIERQLALVREGSEEELNLQKQLVDQKAALDIEEKQKQIKNEKLLAAEIGKINAQTLRDKRKLEDEFIDSLLDKLSAQRSSQTQNANLSDNFIINDPSSTNQQKAQSQLNILKREQADIFKNIADAQNMIVNHRGNIDHLQKRLDDLNNQLGTVNNNIALQGLKLSVAKLQDIADISAKVEQGFNNMSQAASQLSPELSKAFAILGQMAGTIKNISTGLKDFNTASKKEGGPDLVGEITSITSIVGAVTSAIGFVVGLINKAKESKKEALAQIQEFNDRILQGEFAITEEYRQRQREQVTLNKLKLQGLKDETALLNQQKKAVQDKFNDILSQLQQQNAVIGETTKKSGGVFGIGAKTKVVEITQSLAGQTFDQLEALFNKGELTGKAKELFEMLQKLKQEGVDIDKQLQDLQEQSAEIFTGTTADSITDSIIDGFKNGLHSAADFASTFQDLMKEALFNSLKFQYLEGPLKDFFQKFAAASESDNTLTSGEIDNLKRLFNTIISNADKKFADLQQIAGLNLTSSSTVSQNAITGTFRQLSEDTGNQLLGQFNGQRLATLNLLEVQKTALANLNNIELNTANAVAELRAWRSDFVNYTQNIGIKMR
jgi:hypothetical protein